MTHWTSQQPVETSFDEEDNEDFNKEILDAYNDSGLVVLVCLKLEAVLNELLAQFCEASLRI